MTVRPFDWRDLPGLIRYRHHSAFLHSALVLTRGPMLVPGALVSYLAPGTGIHTAVSTGNGTGPALIGQYIHSPNSQFANLTFFTPQERLDSPLLSALIEYIVKSAGERGALRLLAEADEQTLAFDALRDASFAIFSRQRIWQLTKEVDGEAHGGLWRIAGNRDLIAIRSLYNNLVPGLVQQVEPFATQNPRGLVCYQDGNLLAYVELKYGHKGIWAQPFVHPDTKDAKTHLHGLLQAIPYRHSRPVYLCIRSYQSWLENALEDLGAEAGPRQSVMVKHLAVQQKALRSFALPALEGGHPEVTAPILRSESKQYKNETT